MGTVVASILLVLWAAATPFGYAATPVVAFLGDSLTAGQGVDTGQAFPTLVGDALGKAGRPVEVVNAGVSGDTTAGGLRRVDWVLKRKPQVVLVALGSNDGFRGVPVPTIEQNLRQIVTRAKASGTHVILAGMKLPPNLGKDYVDAYEAMFPRVAKQLDVALIPFLLEGVAANRSLNQEDGIHPNPEGHRVIARIVVPFVERALGPASGR